ncbi:TPA: replication initiator protein A [Staphylococcus aureus]|uniref:Replication initiator protein A domain protein n=2 Tax=Staphylococcus aureus TaxID=1280 RepID=A0A0E1X7P5_STAAU|nr:MULTISPECIES: replication initiator protein A [Staphylococcus]EFC01202.1 replication initiator protein [Staphylococcus aureus subsp. aureus C160]EFH95429.1 replication initiator protein A domain protein [Staphylococcus aureus subsp. aureus MN8]EHO92397.1 replication initiator protein A, N-terminal domain protein [Staphylococcus aureus subsp. aureus 21264]EKK3044971.1 replication initiator protein A [Staphylococcus aureus]EKK3149137.1 replication initiator protein A [Staphylococcus aureus]
MQENYKERFYQIPKVFFTSENYKNLTNDMKIAYAILRDRLNLSIKNNWVDEDGNIYFVYSNEKLMEILNCKKEKLTKIKKGLENDGLLIQKRRGLNKPNILYLMKPIVTERDIYKIEKEENDVELYGEKEVRKSNTNDTDFNDIDFNDTENNDMNDLNDIKYKNEISNHSNQFTHNFDDKEMLLQEFPEQLTNYLLKYDYRDLEIIKAVILKAKKSFNSRHEDMHYMLEDIEDEILTSLKRLKKAIHDRGVKGQKETIKSMQAYLMQTILTELEETHALYMRRKNMKQYNIFNQ